MGVRYGGNGERKVELLDLWVMAMTVMVIGIAWLAWGKVEGARDEARQDKVEQRAEINAEIRDAVEEVCGG